jgi:subtilisin family serine protease
MKSVVFSSLLIASSSVVATKETMTPQLLTHIGKKIPDQYFIRLQNQFQLQDLHDHIFKMKDLLGDAMELLHIYENFVNHQLVSYSAKLTSHGLTLLLQQDDVVYIEEDGFVSLSDCQSEINPDWGLARVNHHNYTYGQTYTYDYTTDATGSNVDAYIVDTGIYCENNDFTSKVKGTCTFGYTAVNNDVTDGNGHGTHCAGTVAGQVYGVAKEANLIAVKVLSDSGSGAWSGVIAGMNWVTGQSQVTGRRSVANLSIGGSFIQTVNDAVNAAVAAGVTVAVAAGNDNSNACNFSPASAADAITVGATDKTDGRASYSNYGTCLDIFGPGSAITSAWIGSPSATNTISGTSMASPHVAGTAAKILSQNPSFTPAQVLTQMVNDASVDEISDVKVGSPNLMVYGTCS